MHITITLYSDKPIYEQLKDQIKSQIHTGVIAPMTQMPSVRVLSKELKIGIITVKRAYDELVQEGYLIAKAAVGYFSQALDREAFQAESIKKIEAHIHAIHQLLHESNLSVEVAMDLLTKKGEKPHE